MNAAIRTIGVIGTGVIGSSWTALFLAHGLKVIVSDPAPGAKDRLDIYLQREWPNIEKRGLSPGASIKNYKFVEKIDDYLDKVDFIQENAPERLDFKLNLIAHIDAHTRHDVVIASSSSGIPSSKFVTTCKNNPARVLIGHPFNPPHLVPLVEVVPHPGTDRKYTSEAMRFYSLLNKTPVLVRQECPGFIANRLQAAVCNEAYSLVQRGIVSAEDLDATVTSGLGLRWAITGPFMTNILGGGGGIEGFRHIIEHLGPASQMWAKDMDDHAFQFDAKGLSRVEESVKVWLDKVGAADVEAQRDEFITEAIKFKVKAKQSTCNTE